MGIGVSPSSFALHTLSPTAGHMQNVAAAQKTSPWLLLLCIANRRNVKPYGVWTHRSREHGRLCAGVRCSSPQVPRCWQRATDAEQRSSPAVAVDVAPCEPSKSPQTPCHVLQSIRIRKLDG